MGVRFLAASSVVVACALARPTARGTSPPEPQAAAREENLAARFSGEPAALDDPRVTEIKSVLLEFGAAIRARDAERARSLFDSKRLVEESKRAGGLRGLPANQEAAFAAGFLKGVGRGLVQNADLLGFESVEIRGVTFLASADDAAAADKGDDEAVAYVRMSQDDLFQKYRFWFARSDGTWRIYDFEDLHTPIRISDALASVDWNAITRGGPSAMRVADCFRKLQEAKAALFEGEFAKADELLRGDIPPDFPKRLRAIYCLFQSVSANGVGDHARALRKLEIADSILPDLPSVAYARAITYNEIGEHENALRHASLYLELLGDDADGFIEQGDALRGLGRLDEAADAYRRGLADNPNAIDCLSGLAVCDATISPDELAKRIRDTSDPALAFDTLCWHLDDASEYGALRRTIDAYAPLAPDDPNVAYYLAMILIAEEKYAEAAATIFPAIKNVEDEDEKSVFMEVYLSSMVYAEKPLDGYRNAPDPVYAYEYVADELIAEDRIDALEALTALHAKEHAEDRWIPYYVAIVHQSRSNWAAMAAHCEANARESDEYADALLRELWIAALWEQEKYVEAFEKITPTERSLGFMARWAMDEEDTARLARVIEAYRTIAPDDPAADLWEAESLWRAQRYAESLALWERIESEIPASSDDRWRVDDRRVDCLLKLNRNAEAFRAAQTAPDESQSMRLLIRVHAVEGEVKQTRYWLEKARDTVGGVGGLYRDEIFAAAMRRDAFAKLRADFPNPFDEVHDASEDDATDERADDHANGDDEDAAMDSPGGAQARPTSP